MEDMTNKNVLCPNCDKRSDRQIREIEFAGSRLQFIKKICSDPCPYCGYPDLEATKVASERVILARRLGVKDIFDE